MSIQRTRSIARERAGEQGDTCFVHYPVSTDQKRFLEFHLRRGTSEDERNCLAIRFYWDEKNVDGESVGAHQSECGERTKVRRTRPRLNGTREKEICETGAD